jgi:hypothetical protein
MALEPDELVTLPHDEGPEQTTAQLDPPHATSMPQEPWPEQRMEHLDALVQSTFAHAPSPQETAHGMPVGHRTDAQLFAVVQSMEHPPSTHVPPAATQGPAHGSAIASAAASRGASLPASAEESTPESTLWGELPVQHTSHRAADVIAPPQDNPRHNPG